MNTGVALSRLYVVCLADWGAYQHRYSGGRRESGLVRSYEGSGWPGPDIGVLGDQHGCRASLEKYISDFVETHLAGNTGMVNVETIDGKIIELHLRFSPQ
jgi:hypothetical protein